MPKLTLHADQEIITEAKKFASENQTTVSSMFSRFIRSLIQRENRSLRKGAITRRVSGVISLPEDKDPNQILTEELSTKYGLRT